MNSAPVTSHHPVPDLPDRPLLGLANAVLRRRHLVYAFTFAIAAIVVPATLLRDRTYTSFTSIMPTQRGYDRGVVTIADRLGIGTAGMDVGGATAQFYADLLLSREILTSVINTQYIVHTGRDTTMDNLASFLGVQDTDSLLREGDAIGELKKHITVSVDTRTGVIHVAVTLPQGELARDASLRLVDELNRFNLERRQSQASSERRFTEARLRDVRQELTEAEDKLAEFGTRNMSIQSPALQLQRDRLAREVMVRQSVYSTLANAYEQARIDEVRDTPVLTIIEHPILSARPDSRHVVRLAVMSLLAGGLIGVILALQMESLAGRIVSDGDPRSEFRMLVAEALAEVHSLGGRRRRPAGSSTDG